MSSIVTELAATLSTVHRSGDFFCTGRSELLAPRMEVDGVGAVALPLLPFQAEQLVAAAERAPYGRGEATLTDTAVRRTWQINPDRVRISGRHWQATLDAIAARAAEGLGVTETVAADFYKLLVYDRGSFFVRHRDTEKVPGMFATLILVLPSMSAGGELVVRHKDREARLDLRCDDPSEVVFAAFYADCVHEVLPVTSGYRLALVYNLVRRGRGRLPEPPDHTTQEDVVARLLREWAADPGPPDEDMPAKLIYPLEHAYTPAELDFDALKGADAGAAKVVVAAARSAGCDVHLALVSIEETGSAEHTGYSRSRRGWSDDNGDAFEAGEMFERSVTASDWRRSDGEPSPLTEIPVRDEEFSPPDAFDDLEPDEEHFHEATGNEGASYERTYRRAALVLWPHDKLLTVINQAGLKVTLPYLADLADRWEASGEDHQSTSWRQAHELSTHMVAEWPAHGWHPSRDKERTETGQMLNLLTRLGDVELLDRFLAEIAGRGAFNLGDSAAIVAGIRLLTPERAASVMTNIVIGAAGMSLAACGALLVEASAPGATSLGHAVVTGAAKALVDALPNAAPRDPWQSGPRVTPEFVVDLFVALPRIDHALADRAAAHMLARPGLYDFDTTLIPAVRELLKAGATAGVEAVRRLRLACVAHLDARVAEPLEAPRDWRRASAVGCNCAHCTALSGFLADPASARWVLRAKEADRSHLANTVRAALCDVDTVTERRGSPHSLICTKNQASYERRKIQRGSDLKHLEWLHGQ
jgi:predicted 2-oxoglutarate/Fe(II)-dependent dioxygenase YbiX